MKITRIEIHAIRVPFDMGAAPRAFAGMSWTSVDSLFVRVLTDESIEGWGEGWGHAACPATAATLSTLVRPAFIGRDVGDRAGLMREMRHRFLIHGRTGPVVYALSALEIALWDIAGQAARQSIATLLGGAPRELDAYASLLRYGEPELVAEAVERALSQGVRHLKLHEERMDVIDAARRTAGESTWLALDTNCPWSVAEAIARARALAASPGLARGTRVAPGRPAGLARVRAATTTPIAAGENMTSLHDLASMIEARAVDIWPAERHQVRRHRGRRAGGRIGAGTFRRLRAALLLLRAGSWRPPIWPPPWPRPHRSSSSSETWRRAPTTTSCGRARAAWPCRRGRAWAWPRTSTSSPGTGSAMRW